METFQQPKIVGYRQLTEAEAALMNEIKAEGERLSALIVKLGSYSTADVPADGKVATDPRWIAIGRTHLQEGLMALTRAVAQPTSF